MIYQGSFIHLCFVLATFPSNHRIPCFSFRVHRLPPGQMIRVLPNTKANDLRRIPAA